MTDELLTTRQLANRFGLSPVTLQQWRCHAEGPPFIKEGPRVYYRLEDVHAFERQKLEQLTARILMADRPLAVARSMAAAFPIRKRRGHRRVVVDSVTAINPAGYAGAAFPSHGSSPPSPRIVQPVVDSVPDAPLLTC